MKNPLGKNFKFYSLLKFAMPSIVMMIFMAFYTMVDGAFVARLIGVGALAAVNIIYPIQAFVIAFGLMLGTGGSAFIAKQMGEGLLDEARANFSLIVVISALAGIILTVLGIFFIKPLLIFLGATAEIYDFCYDYAFYILLFVPSLILQMLFSALFIAAGKPSLGLITTVIGGVLNIVLDYVFIAKFGMGIKGAAIATGIGFSIPAIVGLLYFAFYRKGTLFIVTPSLNIKALWQSCLNGSSEMVTQLSAALIVLMFNQIMMRLAGPEGVAAITIAMYGEFLMIALIIGFSLGIAPIISFNHGSRNHIRLKRIIKMSLTFLALSSLVALIAINLLAKPLIHFFTPENENVFNMTIKGFRLFFLGFILAWFNVFASAMFTAFNNGIVSASISFLRSIVFIVGLLIILPHFFGITGVWIAVPIAEVLTAIIAAIFFFTLRKKYGY